MQYVQDGWNYTGDAYLMDTDGYHHQSRTDDMIVSAGWATIAAPEVEQALLQHAGAECAVIGEADPARPDRQGLGAVKNPRTPMTRLSELQELRRQRSPYKYRVRSVPLCVAYSETGAAAVCARQVGGRAKRSSN
jgi:2-aminobenzoate-CoA ligase